MLVGSGLKNDNGGTALAFHSTDSVNWEYKGRALQLDNPDDYPDLGDVWELPVLLPLGTDADGNEKHILCINPAKGDADMEVFYWIGEWDPANFTFTRDHQDPYLIDSGDSHFTGPSGFIDPARDHANFDPATDRSILFTIAQDFRKPHLHDNSGWAHNAGTPMELQLRDDGRLGINPIEEMTRARAEKVLEMHDASPGLVDDALENLTANTVELQLEIEPNQANEYGFYSHHSPGGEEKTLVYYDEKDGKIKTDRRDTSDDRTLMEEEENRSSLQTEGAVDIGSENLTLRVFIDKSLIECYVNSLHSVTTRAYPSRDDSTELRLYQAGPGDITVRSIEIWEMEDVQNGTTSGNGIVDGATYKITNRNSGKVLDVEDAGTSDGDYAVQWEWLGGANQKWVAHEVADGVYELENVNSGKVLDIEDAGTSDGDYAMQWESWGGDNQRWTIDRVGDGYHRVRNVNSGKVLDVEDAGTSDGDYAVQWEWWGGDNQQWQFERLD
jgi:hypothetical protein